MWLTIGSTVVGVVFTFVITHLYYRRGFNTKQLIWTSWTAKLVQPVSTRDPHLTIFYDETPVNGVAITWLMVWNTGRAAIRATDISSQYPLTITAGNESILSARIVAMSNPATGCKITHDEQRILAEFAFLNFQDGMVIQVVHTGTSSKTLELEGVLIDARPPRRVYVPHKHIRGVPRVVEPDKKAQDRIEDYGMFVLLPAGIAILLGLPALAGILGILDSAWGVIGMIMLIFVLFITMILLFIEYGPRLTYHLPVGIGRFHDDGESSNQFWDRWEAPPDCGPIGRCI